MSFSCLTPEGAPVEVELDSASLHVHFPDHTQDLPLDGANGDLNALRHYLGMALRSGQRDTMIRAAACLGQLLSPWSSLLREALTSSEAPVRHSAASALTREPLRRN